MSSGTVTPEPSIKRAVAGLVQEKGTIAAAAEILGLSSDSVVRLMAGAPVRRVTLNLVKMRLEELSK